MYDDINEIYLAIPGEPHIKGYNGEDLKKLMPNKPKSHNELHLKKIEQLCERTMENAAKADFTSCKFLVKDIFPGLPLMDRKEVLEYLLKRLSQRKGITCKQDKSNDYLLIISWA